MALEELQRGKWWIEGVLRWLTDESVQIMSIGWRDRVDGGRHELEVVTPQGTRCETFSKAELETLMTHESVARPLNSVWSGSLWATRVDVFTWSARRPA